ncbi:MAG: nuclear transport factor 2 family protein [Pseudomonadota bacterium]
MGAQTVEQAEQAFYNAFEQRDLSAMRALWDATDDIVCVHPMASPLQGVTAVMQSWQQLFAGDEMLRFKPHIISRFVNDSLATHHLYEQIFFGPRGRDSSVVIATNAYRLTDTGWRMIMHHGSPGSILEAPSATDPGSPLH